jgi:hypothetical protein
MKTNDTQESFEFGTVGHGPAPLVVAYGVGVDSTAMLVAMHQRGIRPDLILFSDPGGEKRETYAYIPIMNDWLRKVGFPEITCIAYAPKRAPYKTLEQKCLQNATLPSLAFGRHSCSIVFKADPQHRYVKAWRPAIEAWAAGIKVIKAIGYDNGAQDCRRRAKADRAVAQKAERGDADATFYEYAYLLQDWSIDRIECLRLIAMAGLPVPMKSACWFCPASKKSEIVWLRDTHPDLFARALALESNARDGRHGLKTVMGLGRSFAWSDLAHIKSDDVVDSAETLRP